MNKERSPDRFNAKTSVRQGRRKLGQILLVTAVALNGLVLAISLHLTSLETELQEKRYEEQYFILNDKTKNEESAKTTLLDGTANQIVMLRRLAEDRMTPDENQIVLSNVKELRRQLRDSKVKVIAVTYLLAHDPPKGTDVYGMFAGKSDSELLLLQDQYERDASAYGDSLKAVMVEKMDSISIWKYAHSAALVLSTIILIVGSIINFRSDFATPN
jgi:hypothetical protein